MKNREEKIRSHRIVMLDRLFHENDFLTVEKIMSTFEVCKRTVQRDIDFLRDRYQAPISKIRGKGYYYSDKTFALKNFSLTEGEMFAITSILPLMEQYKNTPLENSFRNIAIKLKELFPEEILINSSFINDSIKLISDPLPKIDEKIFSYVFDSIIKKISVEGEYISLKRNGYEKKLFDCYKLVCQKGNWYALAYEHKSQEIKIFSLSRMKNIKMTNFSFTIPQDFNIENYVDLYFGIWNNKTKPVEYELLFAKEIALYIREREWHPKQVIRHNADGTVYLKFKSNQDQEIKNWVRSWGNLVTVLSPKKLKDELVENAKKVLLIYTKK